MKSPIFLGHVIVALDFLLRQLFGHSCNRVSLFVAAEFFHKFIDGHVDGMALYGVKPAIGRNDPEFRFQELAVDGTPGLGIAIDLGRRLGGLSVCGRGQWPQQKEEA